jgi:hypothetical protein
VQGTSRALSEEVSFDRVKVTSTDWLSYQILDITEAPEAVDIVLINRPELPPTGAGESSIRPVAAALANAVFDATGVRLVLRQAAGRSRADVVKIGISAVPVLPGLTCPCCKSGHSPRKPYHQNPTLRSISVPPLVACCASFHRAFPARAASS